MKSFFLFFLLLLGWMVSAHSQQVIDYPEIEANLVREYFEIYQVERTDTAVLLRGNVYNRPEYWVQLDTGWLQGRTTGKQYRLMRSYEFPLSKKVGMSVSGSCAVTLQFELPDPKDKIVDFYDQDGSISFKGIHLHSERTKDFCCLIRGSIREGALSSRLVLVPYDTDIRVQPYISVPVRDGKFEFPFHTDQRMVYTLFDWHDYLKGSWRPMDFWVEPGEVELCYSPACINLETEMSSRAVLNQEMLRFDELQKTRFSDTVLYNRMKQLRKEGRYYTSEMDAWIKVMEKEGKGVNLDSMLKVREQLELAGEVYTPEMNELQRKFERRQQQMYIAELEYACKPSLNGLFLLVKQLEGVVKYGKKIEVAGAVQIFQDKYQKKFAGHPLAVQAERYIGALDLREGGHFIDFTAPDLKGQPVKVSDYIRGKVALIDLWASWCGGCRKASKSMIPVYQDFKDKGFTIVGIARESGNTKDMEDAIRRDGYPWLNLVELNDRGAIWYKYGVGGAGGKTFLVDQQGVILAVQPTAEEVRQILEELLRN